MHVETAALSDDALVRALSFGDENALEELFRRHGGVVFGLARRVVGDDALAEDVTQEVFLALWRRPEVFDRERGNFRSWCLMRTHTRAVDVLRSNRARSVRELPDPSFDARVDIEQEALDLLTSQRVRDAIAALPRADEIAVRLAYFGGLSYREVASQIGEPEGTTKSRIRRALRALAVQLADLEVGERFPPTASRGGSRNDR